MAAGRLQGKVCVITGAGGGMGRDAAILFTEEGASVCVADIDGAAAGQTAALCPGSLAQQVDVADEASVEAMMARPPGSAASTSSTTNPGSHGRRRVRAQNSVAASPRLSTKALFFGTSTASHICSSAAADRSSTSRASSPSSEQRRRRSPTRRPRAPCCRSNLRELAVQFAREHVRVNALCPVP